MDDVCRAVLVLQKGTQDQPLVHARSIHMGYIYSWTWVCSALQVQYTVSQQKRGGEQDGLLSD